MTAPKRRSRMTADEIRFEIEHLARGGGEGSDKRWALKVLSGLEGDTGVTMLPPPMTDGEVAERIARFLVGAGKSLSAAAVTIAFRGTVQLVERAPRDASPGVAHPPTGPDALAP